MKKILISLAVLVIAFFLGVVVVKACTNKQWTESSRTTCVSNGECGTTSGTQSISYVCEAEDGGEDTCSLGTWVGDTYTYTDKVHVNYWPYFVCPSGYSDQGYDWRTWPKACRKVDVAGHFVNPGTKTDTGVVCSLEQPDFSSCEGPQDCPTACGYQGGTVPNGEGGTIKCDATPDCVVEETKTTETPLTPASAPQCQDGNILALPIAFQVVRQGDIATLTWYKTGGDKVNVYYKEVGQENWTHAVGDIPNVDPSNSFVVKDLVPSIGYIFAIEQHQGCAGGQLAQSVVVDGPAYQPVLFTFSYWQWSK